MQPTIMLILRSKCTPPLPTNSLEDGRQKPHCRKLSPPNMSGSSTLTGIAPSSVYLVGCVEFAQDSVPAADALERVIATCRRTITERFNGKREHGAVKVVLCDG